MVDADEGRVRDDAQRLLAAVVGMRARQPMSATRQAAWRNRFFSSEFSSMPEVAMKASVQSINSSPCCGERGAQTGSIHAAAASSASFLRSSASSSE